MSSLTKAQFREELEGRSSIVSGMDNSDIDTFIDIALRIYSGRLPKVKWSIDNTVVDGQELYDFPTDALRIVSVRTTSGRERVQFGIEDQGSGEQIRIGSIQRGSVEDLMLLDYYTDPLNFQTDGKVVVTTDTILATDSVGYEAFDVEYAELQTIPTVAEASLEVLTYYIEYLALNLKADGALEALSEQSSDVPASVTDASSDGSSTTISFDSQSDVVKSLKDRAEQKLDRFNTEVKSMPYGTRG